MAPSDLQPPNPRIEATRLITGVCVALIIVFAIGLVASARIAENPLSIPRPSSANVFYYLYAQYEPQMFLGGLLMAVVLYLTWQVAIRKTSSELFSLQTRLQTLVWSSLIVGTFLVTGIGTYAVYENFPLSMDEYMAVFQAGIFRHGHVFGTIPEIWRPFGYPMTPLFATYESRADTWISPYLPGYSAIRAVFSLLQIEGLTNAFLSAGSIFLIGRIARHIWPKTRETSLVSMLLLFTSAQFLVNGMTSYSMPAHLFFNLLWLDAYVHSRRHRILIMAGAGFLALLLHQVFVHLLFVAPFFLRWLMERRWRTLIPMSATYLAAGVFGYIWVQLRTPIEVAPGVSGAAFNAAVLAHLFGIPGKLEALNQFMNVTLIFSWQSIPMNVFALLAFWRWRKLSLFERDLALGIVISFCFYLFFLSSQGHGWGYRYIHACLGNFALLATAGYVFLVQCGSQKAALSALAVGSAYALAVQLPARTAEVSEFVGPFAQASQMLEAMPESVIVLDSRSIWYGVDLVRNDPFSVTGPRLMFLERLDRNSVKSLQERGSVRLVSFPDLSATGLRGKPTGKQ